MNSSKDLFRDPHVVKNSDYTGIVKWNEANDNIKDVAHQPHNKERFRPGT